MDDFFYGAGRKRPKIFTYVIIVLVTTVLSSATTLALAPMVLKNTGYQTQHSQSLTPSPGGVQTTVNTGAQSQADGPFQVVTIAKNVGPAVVGITNYRNGRGLGGSSLQAAGTGSGIIVDANKGYIVTNNHVIAGANKIEVSLADGRTIEGKLIGADPRTDLAVVQIPDAKELVSAPIGDSKALQVGDPVVAIGNPGGEEFARSVTQGVVSALNRKLELTGESSFELIQTDAAINPGNSGGALVNWQGEVVGINSAKYQQQGFEGMGFAIPISDAWPVLTQIIQTGHASHAGILVSVDNRYNASSAQAQGLPAGALLANVLADGPAGKSGMQAGDIITSVNDKQIKSYYDLNHELFKYKIGDTVKLVVYRSGKNLTVNVTLAELPVEQ